MKTTIELPAEVEYRYIPASVGARDSVTRQQIEPDTEAEVEITRITVGETAIDLSLVDNLTMSRLVDEVHDFIKATK